MPGVNPETLSPVEPLSHKILNGAVPLVISIEAEPLLKPKQVISVLDTNLILIGDPPTKIICCAVAILPHSSVAVHVLVTTYPQFAGGV